MMPESPSSPETHTQGLEVVMALFSFLMGYMATRYGITVATEQHRRCQTLANWVEFVKKKSQI